MLFVLFDHDTLFIYMPFQIRFFVLILYDLNLELFQKIVTLIRI
jgi:hypothetical protein